MITDECKSGVIRLDVRGIGDVPAMKNNKMITRGKLITNPKRQKWMEHCIQLIESQLLFAMQTDASGTLTAQQVRSWIASNMPASDSRQWVPKLNVDSSDCDKGEEGATIEIEKL
jgi:hypothetical protein